MRLSGRSLAWLNPDSLGDWNSNNLLFSVGDPDVVALVVVLVVLLGHWHGSNDGEKRASHGENTVGEHVDAGVLIVLNSSGLGKTVVWIDLRFLLLLIEQIGVSVLTQRMCRSVKDQGATGG